MEIGLTWCGDPDAFWRWPLETQERVLGWYRARQPAPKLKRKAFQPRDKDMVDPAARAFWGL